MNRALLLSTLLLAACVVRSRGPAPPAQAPAGGPCAEELAFDGDEGPDALASRYDQLLEETLAGGDQEECPRDGVCELACPEGGCEIVCAGGSACQASCTGGGCAMTCAPGATCDFDCAGGGCRSHCAPGSTCDAETD